MDLTKKSDIQFIIKTAQAASKLIMEYYEDPSNLDVESKTDNSPVTIADKKSSELIIKQLHILNNKIPVISEENAESENLKIIKNHRTYWLIDPIDGTWSFIKKKGHFTINIALVKNGLPIWGLIISPLDENAVYYIDHNNEAIKMVNGKCNKISSSPLTAKGYDFLVSHQNLNQKTQDFLAKFKVNTITPVPSSIKLALMSEGIGHIYPRFKDTCIWDTAAGHAILKNVGGEIFNANTLEPLRYDNQKTLINPNFIAVSDINTKELF